MTMLIKSDRIGLGDFAKRAASHAFSDPVTVPYCIVCTAPHSAPDLQTQTWCLNKTNEN